MRSKCHLHRHTTSYYLWFHSKIPISLNIAISLLLCQQIKAVCGTEGKCCGTIFIPRGKIILPTAHGLVHAPWQQICSLCRFVLCWLVLLWEEGQGIGRAGLLSQAKAVPGDMLDDNGHNPLPSDFGLETYLFLPTFLELNTVLQVGQNSINAQVKTIHKHLHTKQCSEEGKKRKRERSYITSWFVCFAYKILSASGKLRRGKQSECLLNSVWGYSRCIKLSYCIQNYRDNEINNRNLQKSLASLYIFISLIFQVIFEKVMQDMFS